MNSTSTVGRSLRDRCMAREVLDDRPGLPAWRSHAPMVDVDFSPRPQMTGLRATAPDLLDNGVTMTTSEKTVNSIDELKAMIGEEMGVSDWVEITQDRVNQFADVTGDHQWI